MQTQEPETARLGAQKSSQTHWACVRLVPGGVSRKGLNLELSKRLGQRPPELDHRGPGPTPVQGEAWRRPHPPCPPCSSSVRAWTQQSAHHSATPHTAAGCSMCCGQYLGQGPRRWRPGPPATRALRGDSKGLTGLGWVCARTPTWLRTCG